MIKSSYHHIILSCDIRHSQGQGVIQSYTGASAEMKAVLTGEDSGTKRTPSSKDPDRQAPLPSAERGEAKEGGDVVVSEPGPGIILGSMGQALWVDIYNYSIKHILCSR